MNTETFRSSIDWSHEFVNSIVWILTAFAITVPCLLVVLVLIGRMTEWGRQFWRITGTYFTGRQSRVVWATLALLLLSTIIAVRITVLISYYANDVFTSLQVALQGLASGQTAVTDSGIHGFWVTIGIFLVLAVVHVIVTLLDMYVMQRFIMRWRIWLSSRLIDDWLDDHAYFRRQFFRRPNDNPDQRIQQDIDIFTTGVGGQPNNPAYGSSSTLLFGAVAAVLSVVSFGAILWRLSGPLTLGGLTLPRALFWIVIAYVLAATVIAFVIGRPLIELSYLNELRNAGFRYALVRVRDASAAIGLYGGENVERRLLGSRLSEVMANYGNWLNRMIRFTGWNMTVSQAINPLPYVVQAPRLFAGQISFGDVIQSATAFATIHNALSFFRQAYDEFAGYRAAVIRLDGLVEENSRARTFSQVKTTSSSDGSLEVDGVEVRTPDGAQLVRSLDLRLEAGRHTVGQRTVRHRENRSAAESCRALAVRIRECSTAVRQTGGVVRAAAALPSPRRSPRRRVLSQRGGHGRRPRDSTGPDQGRPAAPGHPPQRLRRLGKGALGRRTAEDRLRPHPVDQAESGIPRRVDVGTRRGSRADAVRTDPG